MLKQSGMKQDPLSKVKLIKVARNLQQQKKQNTKKKIAKAASK